jgi:hypothetical protein
LAQQSIDLDGCNSYTDSLVFTPYIIMSVP